MILAGNWRWNKQFAWFWWVSISSYSRCTRSCKHILYEHKMKMCLNYMKIPRHQNKFKLTKLLHLFRMKSITSYEVTKCNSTENNIHQTKASKIRTWNERTFGNVNNIKFNLSILTSIETRFSASSCFQHLAKYKFFSLK